MATKVFVGDVDGRAFRDGKVLIANETGIEPGLLCVVTSGSLATLAGASDAPHGVAYGARQQIYRPDSKAFGLAEQMALLKGDFGCYYSADFFTGGSLPDPGATLYSAASGKMHTTGSYKVGRCERPMARIEEVGGVGTSQDLVHVIFELKP